MKIIVDTEETVGLILERKYRVVGFECPEGLKPQILKLAHKIEDKTGCLVIVIGEPCRGPCDIKHKQLEDLVEALFHFAHRETTPIKSSVSIHYIPVKIDSKGWINDVSSSLKSLADRHEKIGLLTTPPYSNLADAAERKLRELSVSVLKGKGSKRLKRGEILGCDVSSALEVLGEVEAFLLVGDGLFHALGVALTVDKPVYKLGPENTSLMNVKGEAEKLLVKRLSMIEKVRDKKEIGIIIGLKPGQMNLQRALRLKAALEKEGRTVNILAFDEVKPSKLLNFPSIEAFIVTACPRIAIDDYQDFNRPIITAAEAEYMVGLKRVYRPF